MKKILFNGLIVLLLISCRKTPKEQAEKSVKDYIISHSDNSKNYEPVAFGKLDKNDRSPNLSSMKHSFRLKNKKGTLVLDSAVFYFDENMKIIKSTEIIEEEYVDYIQSIDSSLIMTD